MRRRVSYVPIVVALLLAGAATRAADWPTLLGPGRDGKSGETGIIRSWGANGPQVVWTKPAGVGYAAPSVSRDRLFLFDRQDDQVRLIALSRKTGEELWQSTYRTDYEDRYGYSNGPRATPVVDGDRVYTFGAAGRLRCHLVKDGKLVWEVDTAKGFGVVQNFFGVGSTPVVEGELLIVSVGGSRKETPRGNGSGIVAFDKLTGKVRYTVSDELASYSSPTLATIGERRWGFLLARGGLVGFEPASGKLDFHFPFRAKKLESVNASNPVVVGDRVFITETYGPGSALLRVRPGGYEVIRRDRPGQPQSMSCHFMTPIHVDGTLYGSSGRGTGDAELRAVDLVSGKIRWRQPGLGRSTLLWADGHLLVFTEHGRLLLVEATAEAYRAVADATPSRDGNPLLQYPAWSPPALSDGLLYLRGKDRLACLRLIARD